MISFRFHLVSVVAVFLALAIGILVGSTVIDRAIVEGLRDRVEDVRENLRERQLENDELSARVEELEAFVGDGAALTVDGRLEGTVALVVTDAGVDREPVDRTIELLDEAGAAVRGVLTVRPEWRLTDEDRRLGVAEAVGLEASEPVEVLQARAAELLVADITSAVEVVDDGTGALDQIAELQLVDFEVLEDVIVRRPSRVLVVVVSGPESDLEGSDHTEAFATAAADTVGAVVQAEVWADQEDGPDRADSLAAVLGDPALAARIATVDDLDLPMGPTTVVMALVAARAGEVGHFGVGDGAQAAAPPPPDDP